MSKATGRGVSVTAEGATMDRRKSERADLVVRVDYQTVDQLFSDFARNINEGGLFVETENPTSSGTAVSLQFTLPGSEEPIQVRGRVVRTSDGSDGEPRGMGIEFDGLDTSARQRIDDLVRKLRADARRPLA
jgi:type IV pilus assembly protein PilZ